MKILERIRRLFKRDTPLPSTSILCWVRAGGVKEMKVYHVIGTVGFHLVGVAQEGSSTRLIGLTDVVDQRQFKALWKCLSPISSTAVWEHDGSKVVR